MQRLTRGLGCCALICAAAFDAGTLRAEDAAGATRSSPDSASGAEAAARFGWSSPPECPARGEVLASLASLTPPRGARWERFESVRGRVTRAAAGWALELEFEGGGQIGRRRFETRACSDLAHAAAVALALALDPDVAWSNAPEGAALGVEPSAPGARPTPSDPLAPAEPSPEAPPQAAAPDAIPAPATRANSAGSALELRAGVGGVLDPSSLGDAAFGATLFSDARVGVLAVGLYATWLPRHALEVDAGHVGLELLSAGVRGCYHFGAALGLCPSLDVGRLAASGNDLLNARRASDWWVAPGIGLAMSSDVSPAASVAARITLQRPLVRAEYFVNETERVHRVPALTLQLAVGVAFRLL